MAEYVTLSERSERPQDVIPPQLSIDGFRFILLKQKDKPAIEKDWNKDKNYKFDDPKLLEHIRRGGNYGVIPSSDNLCIVDADDYERLNQLGTIDIFSNTFTVRTGNPDAERYHYYFRCEGIGDVKKIPFYDPVISKKHLGEIFCPGCSAYVLGPGCIHPSGRVYQIVNDVPIQSISVETLDKEFFSKIKSRRTKEDNSTQRATKIPFGFNPPRNKLTDQLKLRIEDLAMPINATRRGHEYQGAHPVHGSTTGKNFSINTLKNVWFCHRCQVGGDPITWIAVKEGFIRCEDAENFPVEADLFIKVKDVLSTKYGYANEIRKIEEEYQKEKYGEGYTSVNESDLKRIKLGETIRYTSELPADNFIQKYVSCMTKTTDAYTEYHHACALSILSTLTNRNAVIYLQQGTIYGNIWSFCLGISTYSKKSTALKAARNLLQDLTPSNELPQSFSPESLVEVLSETPQAWIIKDEVGALLVAIQKKTYMSDVRDIFCELYECNNYRRVLRKGRGGSDNSFYVDDPFLTQVYATTPETFRNNTELIDLTSGWLIRFLYFAPRYWKPSKPYTPLSEESRREISEIKDEMAKLFSVFRESLVEFRLSSDSLDYFQGWQLQRENELFEEGDSIKQAIFGRLSTYAIKLSMIFKIGSSEFVKMMEKKNYTPDEGQIVEIEERYVKEACRQIDEYFLPMGISITKQVERNEITSVQNKILGTLQRGGGKLTRKQVLQSLHLKIKDVEEHMQALVESGEISQVDVLNEQTNRTTKWIVLTDKV